MLGTHAVRSCDPDVVALDRRYRVDAGTDRDTMRGTRLAAWFALCFTVACSGNAMNADAGGTEPSVDGSDTSCAPPAPLPSGPLTRYAGNPLLRNGPEAWDDLKTGPRVVLVVGAGDYRMWYEAVSSSGITAVGYATSSDGLSWAKQGVVISPTLGWEESEVSPNAILVENGEYRLYYHGGGYTDPGGGPRYGNARIGLATSTDGLAWIKRPDPVLDIGPAGAFDADQVAEPRVFAVDGAYRMYYTARDAAGVNTLALATSPDGITWTKDPRSPILDANRWGGFWGGAFVREPDIWHLWRGDTDGGSSLHYMWSLDGIAWTDGPANPVLATSTDPGAADYGLVGDSVSGYRDGGVYRILYTGFNSNLFGTEGRFEGICAAEIAATCP